MTGAFIWFFNNWLYAIGMLLSFIGAIGFLTFLRGFLLGLNQVLYIDAHEGHLEHSRVHTVQGFLIMINAFVAWVFVSALAALFGGAPVNVQLTLTILIVYAIVAAAFMIFKKSNGH